MDKQPIVLSQEEFLESFEKVPRMAIDLLVHDFDGNFLLTRRNIEPCIGVWHIPGGFVLKNETLCNCQKRIAQKELGIELTKAHNPCLVGAFDNIDGDPRGHCIELVYSFGIGSIEWTNTTLETMELKFFGMVPKQIGFKQERILMHFGYEMEGGK